VPKIHRHHFQPPLQLQILPYKFQRTASSILSFNSCYVILHFTAECHFLATEVNVHCNRRFTLASHEYTHKNTALLPASKPFHPLHTSTTSTQISHNNHHHTRKSFSRRRCISPQPSRPLPSFITPLRFPNSKYAIHSVQQPRGTPAILSRRTTVVETQIH